MFVERCGDVFRLCWGRGGCISHHCSLTQRRLRPAPRPRADRGAGTGRDRRRRVSGVAAEIEAAKWMVYYGAWRVDRGDLDAATASKIKLVASETAARVSEQAIRVLGGAGIMREYPVGRIHRDALVYLITEGTAEIQRNIIARSLET